MRKFLKRFSGVFVTTLLLSGLVLPLIQVHPAYAVSANVRTTASADDAIVVKVGSTWSIYPTDITGGVGYAIPATGINRGTGMRFALSAPVGATITAAYITFTPFTNGPYANATVNSVLTAEKTVNAAAFTTIANYQSRRGIDVGGSNNNNIFTASQVAWNTVGTWTSPTTYNSPSLVTMVQDVIDQAGWAANNYIGIFWDDHLGASTVASYTYREGYSYDGDPTKAPLLHVEWTVSATSVNPVIAASGDDAFLCYYSAAWNYSATDITDGAGYTGATNLKRGSGMRWVLDVPKNAIITTAYITFTAHVSNATNTVNSKFTAEISDDAAAFTTIADFQARRGIEAGGANNNYIYTASQVDWNAIGAWVAGTTYNSPSLVTMVQTVVDRSGWAANNHIVIYWDDFAGASSATADANREAFGWDHTTGTSAPKLYVAYEYGAPSVTTVAASSITSSSATINGNITWSGAGAITARGFYWGTNPSSLSYTIVEGGTSTGAYDEPLAGLAPGTMYYFQAYATNAEGTGTGTVTSFTTSSAGSGTVTPYQGYSYAQQFTITGSTAGAGTNIPISLHIYKGVGASSGSTVYLGNHCLNWPYDIVFTSTNGTTLLPYWQETTSATDIWVWVNIPYIPVSPSTTFGYISYGNSLQTTSLSNGDTTFTFFEDFNYASWVTYDSEAAVIETTLTGLGTAITSHDIVILNGVYHAFAEYWEPNSLNNPGDMWHWTSTDMINWTPDPANPILGMTAGTWYASGIADPSAIVKDGKIYLFLGACNVRGAGENDLIGMFVSDSTGFNYTELTHNILPNGIIMSDSIIIWDSAANVWRGFTAQYNGITDNNAPNYTYTSNDASGLTGWTYASKQLVTGLTGFHPLISEVFQYNGTWYMLYFPQAKTGHAEDGTIILATSTNFVNWTTVNGNFSTGYDPKITEVSPTHWYLTKTPKSDGYDTYFSSAFSLYELTGTDFLSTASLSQVTAFTNYIGTSASITNSALSIIKSSKTDMGVQYNAQLPTGTLIGFKLTNYDAVAAHLATASILNKSGTGSATNEVTAKETNAGSLTIYSNTTTTTTVIGAGALSTQYDIIMEIQSPTTIAELVRGFAQVSITRTSTTTNFLHFGWTPPNTNFQIDDVFIGKLITPSPTFSSWAGGSTSYNGVVTLTATSIQLTSAVLNGQVTSIIVGDSITIVGFDYGVTAAYGTASLKATSTYTLGAFSSAVITGLSANTTYHFRAKMYDDTAAAWTYGGDSTFTTSPTGTPTVTTGSIGTTTSTTATLQGTLSGLGDYTTLYVAFDYGTTTSYGQSSTEEAKTAVGSFNVNLTGLTQGVTYHYRAKVRYGTSLYIYGSDVSFSTGGTVSNPGIDAPDILSIEDVQVFTNYLQAGDQLYLIAGKVIYENTPVANASDYFNALVQDGTVTKATGTVPTWGYGPICIYQANGSSLTWGGLYSVLISGLPNKWSTVPSTSFSLSSSSWQGSDMTKLDSWVIALATRMETYYGLDFVTFTSGSGSQLTAAGSNIFSKAIPGLITQRPNLFSSGLKQIVITATAPPAAAYEESLINNLGVGALEKFEDLGAFLGLSGLQTAGFWWFGLTILVMAGCSALTSLPGMGALVGALLACAGAFLGVIPLSLVAVLACIVLVLLVFQFIMFR